VMMRVASFEFHTEKKGPFWDWVFFLSSCLYCIGWGFITAVPLMIPLLFFFFLFHGSAAIATFGSLRLVKRPKLCLFFSSLFLACTVGFTSYLSYSPAIISYAALQKSQLALSVIALIGIPLFILYSALLYWKIFRK
jgi:hypothetical protein